MPDGNEVRVHCHYPTIGANCIKPDPGTYDAEIDKHDFKVYFYTHGRPDYNKDGSIKKPEKVKVAVVKFSFEDQ